MNVKHTPDNRLEKLLTIGIPTYNRCDILKSNLDILIPLLNDFWDEIELLISDNASSDNTHEMLLDYGKRFPMRVITQEENRGSANNFATLYQQAKGEYVWVLSDDDIVMDGAIKEILKQINSNENIAVLHLNNYFFSGEFGTGKTKIRVENLESFCTTNKDEFMKCIGCHLTFISTLILNKRVLDSVWEQICRDSDDFFLQSYSALLCMSNEKAKMAFISFPCVAAKNNDKVSYNLYDVFGTHLYRVMEYGWLHCNFKKRIMKKQYIKYWRDIVVGGIINAKIKGYKDMYKGFANFFKLTCGMFSAWLFLYPYLLLPDSVYKLAKKIKDRFKKT